MMETQDSAPLFGGESSLQQFGTTQDGGRRHKTQKFIEQANILLDTCKQSLAVEFKWNIDIPRPPKVPLIYELADVRALTDFRGEWLASDLQAFGSGLLDEISPIYFAMHPWDIELARDYVEDNELEQLRKAKEAELAGRPQELLPDPRELNPKLDDEDFALCDVDFDLPLLEQRDLPSLSLFRNPIYTESGAIAPEKRADQRLQRAVEAGTTQLATQLTERDPAADGSVARFASQGSVGGGAGRSLSMHEGGGVAPDVRLAQANEMKTSFRNARALDSQYGDFVRGFAHDILRLSKSRSASKSDEEDLTTEKLGRRLLTLLRSVPHQHINGVLSAIQAVPNDSADDVSMSVASAAAVIEQLPISDGAKAEILAWAAEYAEHLGTVGIGPKPTPGETTEEGRATLDLELQDCIFGANRITRPRDHRLIPQAVHSTMHQRVALLNATDSKAFPTGVYPILPTNRGVEDYEEADAVESKDLSLLLLRGAKPRQFFHGERNVLLDDRTLLHPQKEAEADEDDDDEVCATRFIGDYSDFTCFLQDARNSGHYLFVPSAKQDWIGFRRVPLLKEYHRRISESAAPAVPTDVARTLVVWEDEDAGVTEESKTVSTGRKRAREEAE